MAGYDPNQAPQQGQYYDPNQQYFDPNDPNAQFDEESAYFNDEEGAVVKQLPWMAIALVAHALVLFIAVFIVTAGYESKQVPISTMAKEVPDTVPEIQPEEPPEEEIEEKQQVVEEETTVEETDTVVETNDQSLVDSPIDSPNPNPDDAESPDPNAGPNSNNGLGGGGGGGGGGPRGGGGGFGGRKGITKPGSPDRTNAALQWLADHQNEAGYWNPEKYLEDSIRMKQWADCKSTNNIDVTAHTPKENDKGNDHFRVGITGLSLLAFVGDGHTHKDGDFKLTVKKAASWLMQTQDAEGCFGTRDEDEYIYNHAVCAMAFAELYAMTQTPLFKGPAQLAVDFIVKCQNPGLGWRYGVQPGENDSSVTAWMVLALKSAKIADLKFDAELVYAGANEWYNRVYDVPAEALRGGSKTITGSNKITGYNTPASGNSRPGNRAEWEQNPSMDACNAMVRLFTAYYDRGTKEIRNLGDLMMQDLPTWIEKNPDTGEESALKVDYYYWYYGSLAAFQMGDPYWTKWEKSLMGPILLKYQRGYHPKDIELFGNDVTNAAIRKGDKLVRSKGKKEGRQILDEHGSWDTLDPWSEHGGRVYTTAINALTLEVYYRYAKIG